MELKDKKSTRTGTRKPKKTEIIPEWVPFLAHSTLRCPKCLDEIMSYYRHDFTSCKCKESYIDGGLDYVRHTVPGELFLADWEVDVHSGSKRRI